MAGLKAEQSCNPEAAACPLEAGHSLALTSTTSKAVTLALVAKDGCPVEACTADSYTQEGMQPASVGSPNSASGKHLEPGSHYPRIGLVPQ